MQLAPALSDTENYWGFQGYSPFHQLLHKLYMLQEVQFISIYCYAMLDFTFVAKFL